MNGKMCTQIYAIMTTQNLILVKGNKEIDIVFWVQCSVYFG